MKNILFVLLFAILSSGCLHTSTKGALPYFLNNCDEKRLVQNPIDYNNQIVLLEINY